MVRIGFETAALSEEVTESAEAAVE